MPSNPHKDLRDCNRLIRLVLDKLPEQGMDYKQLILECITHKEFAVSERAVKHFIKTYYIEDKLVRFEDGRLYPITKE